MPQTSTLLEFVVAIHFETDLALKIPDLADWIKVFDGEFPVVDQLPALGRVEVINNPFQIMPMPELPMVRLTTANGRFNLKLQSDRLALGWSRAAPLGAPDEYPGFDEMLHHWHHYSGRFEDWLATRSGQATNVRLIELDYLNAKPIVSGDQKASLEDTFAFMKKVGRSFNGFQMQWTELLESDPFAARVNASAAMAIVGGNQLALTFNFMGFAPLSGAIRGEEVRAATEALHARILDMYEATIISDSL